MNVRKLIKDFQEDWAAAGAALDRADRVKARRAVREAAARPPQDAAAAAAATGGLAAAAGAVAADAASA